MTGKKSVDNLPEQHSYRKNKMKEDEEKNNIKKQQRIMSQKTTHNHVNQEDANKDNMEREKGNRMDENVYMVDENGSRVDEEDTRVDESAYMVDGNGNHDTEDEGNDYENDDDVGCDLDDFESGSEVENGNVLEAAARKYRKRMKKSKMV
ncbi:hypothetical protein QVD17_19480 [Tagetes erecta]|uniref:Uncharacterized protein n=1 Tax=Tagetes erecta TaxID=13708 RepID=A0AAD8KMQ6_TARER|nr:hypothetical protein QVD17_19480 [Tagetes erecta]